MSHEYNLTLLEAIKTIKPGEIIVCETGDRLIENDGMIMALQEGLPISSVEIRDRDWSVKCKIEEPEPEMIALTRPKIMRGGEISSSKTTSWYASRKEFFEINPNSLTYGKWETIEVPANPDAWDSE